MNQVRTASQVENRVAVAQMTATADRAANFRVCEKLAQQAAAQGCSMLFLPECCSFIGESAAEVSSSTLESKECDLPVFISINLLMSCRYVVERVS